jgi:hypothetical protein
MTKQKQKKIIIIVISIKFKLLIIIYKEKRTFFKHKVAIALFYIPYLRVLLVVDDNKQYTKQMIQ